MTKPKKKRNRKSTAGMPTRPAAVRAEPMSGADRVARYVKKRSDIGVIPPPADMARRESCRLDLRKFMTTYFPQAFPLTFSEAHEQSIRDFQAVALTGNRFCDAEPRGFGKSTRADVAVLWMAVYGHRQMVPLLSTIKNTAMKSMRSIQTELESNELLAVDFPEVCLPVERLEGVHQRSGFQLYRPTADSAPEYTGIEWKTEELVLPSIRNETFPNGSPASGVVVCCYGIESRQARGLRYKRKNGQVVRPELVIIDDPQDRKIARNPERVRMLKEDIDSSVLMGGGHTKKLAAIILATVIEKGDLVDRYLADPAWIGRRVAMLESRATAEKELWLGKYADIRRSYQRDSLEDQERAHRDANEFYRANREAMDAGAKATWEVCKNETEISAIQHAYNIWIDSGERVFFAECQNEPLDAEALDGDARLNPITMSTKLNHCPRGTVPGECSALVAFCDVGKLTDIHWLVLGVGDGFVCDVVDFGRIPVQNTDQVGEEASIRAALDVAIERICGREWTHDGGGPIAISRLGIDSGYQDAVVEAAIRESKYRPMLYKTRGMPIQPGGEWHVFKGQPGDENGDGWRKRTPRGGVTIFHYWSNLWKSFAYERCKTPMGGAGRLALFGDTSEMLHPFAEHLAAEKRTRAEAKGKIYDIWNLLPNRQNHWLDCLVGCCALANGPGVRKSLAVAEGPKQRQVRKGGSWFNRKEH